MGQLVFDEKALSKACQNFDGTPEEAREIAEKLFLEIYANAESGAVGLAANQIGIDTRICAVWVTEPFYLINPVVKAVHGTVKFKEGCLSYPDKLITTERHHTILVDADNLLEPAIFSSDGANILECVCVQHEIDHLNGFTMFDRAIENE